MQTENYRSWLDYYRQKGEQPEDLRTISGYDHPLAQLTEDGLADLKAQIVTLLRIQPGDRVLDLGSGAGLITRELISATENITGLDANHEMIRHSPYYIRNVVGAANSLPFQDESFDKTLCHSIFQYFPDLNYARDAISEVMRTLSPGGSFLVMDLPDRAKQDEYTQLKGPETHNLTRIFYDKSWFSEQFPDARIFDHSLRDYKNADYRFNVLIFK
ncbi:MAG: methyltransferase domain-containing protein [Candidatus Curtissbacteria bacterium]|nr:methyltransferase domain-containing protein [Candidatus Curtissbacteria bacterium]